jgi:hypothetical protein
MKDLMTIQTYTRQSGQGTAVLVQKSRFKKKSKYPMVEVSRGYELGICRSHDLNQSFSLPSSDILSKKVSFIVMSYIKIISYRPSPPFCLLLACFMDSLSFN